MTPDELTSQTTKPNVLSREDSSCSSKKQVETSLISLQTSRPSTKLLAAR